MERRRKLRYRVGSALLAVVLFLALGIGPIAHATSTRQCSTAPVQTVKVCVKNCCGHVVGYATRALKPGDKGFVPCQCAEKTTIQVKVSALGVQLGLPSIVTIELPLALPIRCRAQTTSEGCVTRATPPLGLPPDLAA